MSGFKLLSKFRLKKIRRKKVKSCRTIDNIDNMGVDFLGKGDMKGNEGDASRRTPLPVNHRLRRMDSQSRLELNKGLKRKKRNNPLSRLSRWGKRQQNENLVAHPHKMEMEEEVSKNFVDNDAKLCSPRSLPPLGTDKRSLSNTLPPLFKENTMKKTFSFDRKKLRIRTDNLPPKPKRNTVSPLEKKKSISPIDKRDRRSILEKMDMQIAAANEKRGIKNLHKKKKPPPVYRIKFRSMDRMSREDKEMYEGLDKYRFGTHNSEWNKYTRKDMISDIMFYKKLKAARSGGGDKLGRNLLTI